MITHLDSISFNLYQDFCISGPIPDDPAALPEAVLLMAFVILTKVIGILWSDRSSWFHEKSTFRRRFLCSFQETFFAPFLVTTDFSPMTTWLSHYICLTRRYISADLGSIFWRATFSASLLVWYTAHLDDCLTACSMSPVFHSLKHLCLLLPPPGCFTPCLLPP